MSFGKLITLSGIDGAGKSTQCERFIARLEQRGQICLRHQFDALDFGQKAQNTLNQILQRRPHWVVTRLAMEWRDRFPLIRAFVYEKELQTRSLAMAVAAVFAGGSIQISEMCIKPLLKNGIHVLCDRYWYDDLVYRSVWLDTAFLRQLYEPVVAPDLALFLDISSRIAIDRNRDRSDATSPLLRTQSSIDELRHRFIDAARMFEMQTINAEAEPTTVEDQIVKHIQELGIDL